MTACPEWGPAWAGGLQPGLVQARLMTLTEVEPDSGWVSPSRTSLSVLGWSSALLRIPAALTLLVGWGLEFLGGLGE